MILVMKFCERIDVRLKNHKVYFHVIYLCKLPNNLMKYPISRSILFHGK